MSNATNLSVLDQAVVQSGTVLVGFSWTQGFDVGAFLVEQRIDVDVVPTFDSPFLTTVDPGIVGGDVQNHGGQNAAGQVTGMSQGASLFARVTEHWLSAFSDFWTASPTLAFTTISACQAPSEPQVEAGSWVPVGCDHVIGLWFDFPLPNDFSAADKYTLKTGGGLGIDLGPWAGQRAGLLVRNYIEVDATADGYVLNPFVRRTCANGAVVDGAVTQWDVPASPVAPSAIGVGKITQDASGVHLYMSWVPAYFAGQAPKSTVVEYNYNDGTFGAYFTSDATAQELDMITTGNPVIFDVPLDRAGQTLYMRLRSTYGTCDRIGLGVGAILAPSGVGGVLQKKTGDVLNEDATFRYSGDIINLHLWIFAESQVSPGTFWNVGETQITPVGGTNSFSISSPAISSSQPRGLYRGYCIITRADSDAELGRYALDNAWDVT